MFLSGLSFVAVATRPERVCCFGCVSAPFAAKALRNALRGLVG